ncbi:hypothetical protein [Neorhodopirellula pilleata]|uniref:Tetratricopeptide repeat protein n=1 Tax=Neorhodopirellula pilleata TaxID=2714738 RepID=A0A5C5ZG05_9BACT|nr:hypothetical protein [Neorhodopirellula pilleata]TWT86349.1 hypothetical protein Pla100_61350 [Neorhodopirellula pilleata]
MPRPTSFNLMISRRPVGWLFLFIGLIGWNPSPATAQGEPASDFVKRLRAAEYFDLAISYLDRIDQYPGVDSDFITSVPLEKATTYIDAAVVARTAAQRDERFENAENELQTFLKNHPNHARASEARSQLGKLRMFRASQFMIGDVDDEKRKKARELYQAASTTFDNIIEDLKGKLESMKGARIDAQKEPEKAALREQYRFEFLMAKHNAGEARLMAAETFDDPAKNATKQLEEALALYTDLSEKYEAYVQGATAFYSRGRVEQALGKRAPALESYTRMLEQSDADELREAKIGATVGMMHLHMTEKEPKFDEAIKAGEPIEKTLRPNEKRLQSAQDLRLELARAYVAKSKAKGTKPNDAKRATTDARKLLIDLKKVPGTHVDATTKLLEELGIDSAASEEVAEMPTADDPKSFDEAIASARQLIQSVQTLSDQLAEMKKQDPKSEPVQALEKSISEARQTGIVILRRGLAMINQETASDQANEARQFLAFLLLQEQQFRDSFVVGEFLSRFAPGTDVGLRGGLMALSSAQQIISSEGSGNDHWVGQLRTLGAHLVKTWPDDPKAASAQGIMIVMVMEKGDLPEAQKLVDEMPEGTEQAKFRRLLGQLYWNESLRLRGEKKEPQADATLPKAADQLTKGLNGLTDGLAGEEAMKAALVLAKVHLRQDKPDEAVKVIDHPKYGAITLAKKLKEESEDFLFDLYRTELQAVVGQMTASNGSSSGDNEKLLKRASDSIDQLRKTAKGDEGQNKLIGTFRILAADIRGQIESATPDRKAKLIDAFNIFLARISDITNDDATLQWVGQTLLGMAESAIPPGQTKAEGQAAQLLDTAAKTFNELKDKPDAPESIRFMLGRVERLRGNYSDALKELRVILTAKPTMIDAQEEAALAYEQWAATLPPKFAPSAYRSALSGGKEKIVWGWGKISQMAQRNPAFRERFFNARYHVALCRYLQGKASGDAAVTKQAIKDITSLVVLYPDMGGEEQRAKFDALLKQIQQAAGEPVTGLPQA